MTELLSLDPIDYPEGDPYRAPAVHRARERFWWHQVIADELRRLRDECTNPKTGSGYPAFNVPGLAGDVEGAHLFDTVRHCRQMITWGELVKAEPLWDFAPAAALVPLSSAAAACSNGVSSGADE